MSIDKEFRWTGTVNRDLADKYGWWHTEAEKRVAGDVTVAKRTRTQLQNMAKAFEPMISAEQLLAIRAAQSAVGRLILDLQALQPFFKAYSKWKTEKDEQEENLKLDKLAAQRWSSDAAAILEAADLIAFYVEGTDGAEIDAFIIGRHSGCKRVIRDSCFSDAETAQRHLPKAMKAGDITSVRRKAASVLNRMERGESEREIWWVGRADYEAWREVRVAARKAVESVIDDSADESIAISNANEAT